MKEKINEEEARDEFLGDAANGMNEWVDNRHVCMRMTVLHPAKKKQEQEDSGMCAVLRIVEGWHTDIRFVSGLKKRLRASSILWVSLAVLIQISLALHFVLLG